MCGTENNRLGVPIMHHNVNSLLLGKSNVLASGMSYVEKVCFSTFFWFNFQFQTRFFYYTIFNLILALASVYDVMRPISSGLLNKEKKRAEKMKEEVWHSKSLELDVGL